MTAASVAAAPPGRGIAALAMRLAGLTGWRRWLAAGAAGAFGVLALPPIHIVPALLVSFPALLWLLRGCTTRRAAFAVGWWFGFGWFVAGLYWVANALLVDAARFAWLLPFAICGLPALLAFFPALATLATHRLARTGFAQALALAACWSVAEWLRGFVLTGFPWNLVGYVWTGSDAMLQLTALTGIHGLSLLTVLAAALPAALVPGTGRRAAWLVAVPFVLLALAWAGGAWRLAAAEVATVPGVRLRLVQANVAQAMKWEPQQRAAILRRHVEMSIAPPAAGSPPPTHVIWPETAVPFLLAAEPEARALVARAAPAGGAVITGAPRGEQGSDGEWQVWNSLHAIDRSGAVLATYDKAHLVPFGEYMPLRSVLGLSKITAGATDFSAGPGAATVRLPGLPPFSPLICYEVIFPGSVVASGDRPDWLLNITNDGWYGASAGPYQHLAIARVRAVEEGLPLVRAANTGISAVTDAYGRVVGRIPLLTAGVLDADLPAALPPTPYSRLGDGLFWVMLLFVVGTSVVSRRESSRAS